jgi:hypothetical protein
MEGFRHLEQAMKARGLVNLVASFAVVFSLGADTAAQASDPVSPAASGLLGLTSGSGLVDVVVRGNELSGRIELPGGIRADITVAFEEVEGLSLQSLGLSARLVVLDPAFLSRLPSGVSALSVFPVLVVLDPPRDGGLSFRGLPTVSLHTDLLSYEVNTPLRMFAANPGEAFRDVTGSTGSGSLRADGHKPEFAGEYTFVSDLRAVDEVVLGKLVWLEGVLADNEDLVDAPVLSELSTRLGDVRRAVEENRTADAIAELDDFTTRVREESGTAIPDQWRAERDLSNVAGDLRGVAATLRYGLGLEQ